MPWSETELAYLAGFIDGEGSITIFHFQDKRVVGKPGSILRLSIYNTNADVMGWIALRFGGRVGKVKRRRVHGKQGYVWYQSGRRAAVILQACLPYFRVKKQQAELFIDCAGTLKNWGKRKVSAEIYEFRKNAAQKVQALNRGA